ncbi:MAG: flagellar motor switch protein FliM [Candidatus Lambdaproteobacteria bacterium RIFOXYD2_FULL_50_16]|uniref:Flagellar motor switch protein FliM n=1 Tax=Candidatus Lambdaproteobacteria bacterium RIFOXYD2_FULL_50_16 TaxID=1817772 RepID=A0A1F6G4T9_9PROT|nr:MAG: flagellar motor switch protein FliM [Candidatus Lambdaproteobacteria bacterium RIFOXYD2_FULL_50_16]
MSQVLSQDEVDSLLKGIAGGDDSDDFDMPDMDADAVIPYDLTSQDRIIRGRMPTLEIIHDRFVRMFRLTLSSALRKVVDISVRSTELIKFGEFLKTLPVPSSLNLFRMNPLRGNAILVLETRLVFTLIDIFFGGTGELEVKAEGRDFTAIEQKMVKRVVISALEDLQNAWKPVFPLQVAYTRTEINPQFVAIVPHSEVVVVITFDVEMGKAPMMLTICIPYSMVEPIRGKLDSGFQSDQNEEDHVWGKRFRDNLAEAEISLLVELGRSQITVQDFLNLKKGDLLPLNHEAAKPLDVQVEGVTKFRGFQGAYKGKQAIQISEMVYVPPIADEFE